MRRWARLHSGAIRFGGCGVGAVPGRLVSMHSEHGTSTASDGWCGVHGWDCADYSLYLEDQGRFDDDTSGVDEGVTHG